MRTPRPLPRWFVLTASIVGCSAPTAPIDAARPDTGSDTFTADVAPDALDVTALDVDDVAMDTAGDGALPCVSGQTTAAIGTCIDRGTSPRECLRQALDTTGGAPLCDADHDGMADDLEDAMAKSYSLAYAFNQGDGGHTGGDPEPYWPDNVDNYVSNAHLIWRVDNDSSTVVNVLMNPTLATLGSAHATISGMDRRAWDPASGQATNYWLCLDQPGGQYPAGAMVGSLDASRNLPGGIDVGSVVHPTTSDPGGRYAFVASVLYYAYNAHTGVDNHEGDWEGGGVIVDLETGDVVAAYFDRHPTVDNQRLLWLQGAGAVRAIDPRGEGTYGDICSDTDAAAARGVRFYDFTGLRHHAVDYVGTGGHAGYGYPGNTKITGVGCIERTIVRDTHNGDGARFLPWAARYVSDWAGSNPQTVVHGVHFVNVGEDGVPRVPWAAYHGQWGCQQETIAKSYPGPWDNARHCRRWITHLWGPTPPFTTANPSADCTGAP